MSTDDTPSTNGVDTDTQQPRDDEADLEDVARAELLAAENRRLRAEYARARRSQYRNTAIGLASIGLVGIGGGMIIPGVREVLVALGMTGLFGSVLTYYLTPAQFVAADVGERIYSACATNQAAIAAELGLRDDRFYLPAKDGAPRLYIPLHSLEEPIDHESIEDGPFVLDDDTRGLCLEPTGGTLFAEFERTLTGELGETPVAIAPQLCDGIVEQFELAGSADADIDSDGGRVTFRISESVFGDLDRFDHPIPSFLATGLAVGLDRPVELEVDRGGDRTDWLVTCRFDPLS